jgi:hypothetical protein
MSISGTGVVTINRYLAQRLCSTASMLSGEIKQG